MPRTSGESAWLFRLGKRPSSFLDGAGAHFARVKSGGDEHGGNSGSIH
jgi:hypothetical protein